MNKNYVISAHTLNEAWLKTCKLVYTGGNNITLTKPKQKEITNLTITISNSFENEHDVYFKHFDRDIYSSVLRVYSKGGDQKLQKDYWTPIYDNNGINQVKRTIKILKQDPYAKSATIVLSDVQKSKLPCVMDVNFRIRNEKVDMTLVFKSSDVAKKFIPDVVVLSRIHEQISRELHVARGSVTAFVLSAQIHVQDFKVIAKLIKNEAEPSYYNTESVIENWNGDAEQWDIKIKNPNHYVNIENGYSRFVEFAEKLVKDHVTKNQVTLDSGSGTGIIAKMLQKYNNNVFGIDIADKMIKVARKKNLPTTFVLGNCLDIPFRNEYFNAVITRGVLISHVGKGYTSAFIDEAKRVLVPGGLFIFDFITHFNDDETDKRDKKAVFNKKKVELLLKKSGFRVLEFCGEDENRVNAVACVKE